MAGSSFRLWGRLSVGQKVAVIPLLFIVAIAVLLGFTVTTAEDQKLDAVVVDTAGLQRGLLKRHQTEILLTVHGHEADYKATRQEFEKSLATLTGGGPVMRQGEAVTLPPAPNAAVRAKLLDAEKSYRQLLEASDALLKLAAGTPEHDAQLEQSRALNRTAEEQADEVVKAFAAESLGKIESMIRWEFVIALAAAALGIVCSWLIARGILRPLGELVERAQEVAAGDLSGKPLAVTSDDEVGRLATAFNRMLGSLADLTRQTRLATENVNSASVQILASTQQQAASTKEQAATVHEITSTMQEIVQTGRQIIEKAEQVASSAEAAASATESGLKAVRGTTQTMDAIREQVEEVAQNIVSLSEKTQAVGEIVSTVNDIAEQSNLLALNASIEAAAAGADGNRFSVVATEMKHLADQAKQCTVQVRTILGDIRKGINTSVMLTEEAVKRVETGRRQAAASEGTIREMNAATETSIQTFEQIIGAANQQQIGFEQVTQGMQDIRQATEQTVQGTSQLEQAVANLAALGQQLRAAVGRYRVETG